MVDVNIIVIDNGSGLCKAGFGGENIPKKVFSSIVGKPLKPAAIYDINHKDYYFGNEAQNLRGVLNLNYPIQHGIVLNWEYMEQLWHHTFKNELKIDPKDCPILITDAHVHINKSKISQIMFESFNVPSLFIANPQVLALHTSKRLTGIVIDSGDGITQALPIYNVRIIWHARSYMNIAGRDLTDYLIRIMTESGYYFQTSADREIVRNIKEKLCFVESNNAKKCSIAFYELPDGNKIKINEERFRCPEVLFNPSLIGSESIGIDELVYNAIMACNTDMRKDMFSNIVLSGGSTLFPGFADRLQYELVCRAPENSKIKLIASPERKYLVWQGGSMLASSSMFLSMCISKAEYEENGPAIVDKKCF